MVSHRAGVERRLTSNCQRPIADLCSHVHPTLFFNLVSLLLSTDQLFTMDFGAFNPAEQAHMQKVIETKQVCNLLTFEFVWVRRSPSDHLKNFAFRSPQMQDFMKLYSGLVERCFTSCCNDFTSKSLSSKEVRLLLFNRD